MLRFFNLHNTGNEIENINQVMYKFNQLSGNSYY